MTDAEKVEVLERENKLLKEQIELLKEINLLKSKDSVVKITLPDNQPYQPLWTYSTIELNANKC